MSVSLVVSSVSISAKFDADGAAGGIEALCIDTIVISILKIRFPDHYKASIGKRGDRRVALSVGGFGVYLQLSANGIPRVVIDLRMYAVAVTVLIIRFPDNDESTAGKGCKPRVVLAV